jgi:hypothetical protein
MVVRIRGSVLRASVLVGLAMQSIPNADAVAFGSYSKIPRLQAQRKDRAWNTYAGMNHNPALCHGTSVRRGQNFPADTPFSIFLISLPLASSIQAQADRQNI